MPATNRESSTSTPATTIVVAGATGQLGTRIVRALLQQGAQVKALVRPGSPGEVIQRLRNEGVTLVETDYGQVAELAAACAGAGCVVSALSGLREVIVDAQTRLLEAAVQAGVPRFIPSDYAADFTKLPVGANRNFDLRREFGERLDRAPIAATSILNGMFADLLTGQAPVVLYSRHWIVYWGDADQPLDFTTMDDTAAYTARAALDPATPRYLRIAGTVASPRQLQGFASEATGQSFRLFRVGGLGLLQGMIKVTRLLMPGRKEVFPPWQGMQYLHNMLSGQAKLHPLDNDRYPDMRWTPLQEVLAQGPDK